MTAVEWLEKAYSDACYNNMIYNIAISKEFIPNIIAKAKEIEKQQQGYTENEVLEIIRQYALEEHLITSSKPDVWFKQFKNK